MRAKAVLQTADLGASLLVLKKILSTCARHGAAHLPLPPASLRSENWTGRRSWNGHAASFSLQIRTRAAASTRAALCWAAWGEWQTNALVGVVRPDSAPHRCSPLCCCLPAPGVLVLSLAAWPIFIDVLTGHISMRSALALPAAVAPGWLLHPQADEPLAAEEGTAEKASLSTPQVLRTAHQMMEGKAVDRAAATPPGPLRALVGCSLALITSDAFLWFLFGWGLLSCVVAAGLRALGLLRVNDLGLLTIGAPHRHDSSGSAECHNA